MRTIIRFFLRIIGWPMETSYDLIMANTNSLRKVMPVIEVNTGELKKGDQVKAYVKAGPGGKKWLEGLVLCVDKDYVEILFPGVKTGVLVRKAFVKKMRAMKASQYKVLSTKYKEAGARLSLTPSPSPKERGKLTRDNGIELTHAIVDEELNMTRK